VTVAQTGLDVFISFYSNSTLPTRGWIQSWCWNRHNQVPRDQPVFYLRIFKRKFAKVL
jgi:hypothetical protein